MHRHSNISYRRPGTCVYFRHVNPLPTNSCLLQYVIGSVLLWIVVAALVATLEFTSSLVHVEGILVHTLCIDIITCTAQKDTPLLSIHWIDNCISQLSFCPIIVLRHMHNLKKNQSFHNLLCFSLHPFQCTLPHYLENIWLTVSP